jgi:putative transposase
MSFDPAIHHRHAMRLKGYDYSQSGYYFVNICTRNAMCILGEIQNATIRLSPLGRIVQGCWNEIPSHYTRVRLESFQIMPNHIHAIIGIQEPGRDAARPVPTEVNHRKGILGNIVGSFKAAATKAVHEAGHFVGRTIWQSRFYDHIIRDDVAFYFVQQYIELNPLMWEYSRWNRKGKRISMEQFEKILQEQFDISVRAAAIVLGSEKMFDLNMV